MPYEAFEISIEDGKVVTSQALGNILGLDILLDKKGVVDSKATWGSPEFCAVIEKIVRFLVAPEKILRIEKHPTLPSEQKILLESETDYKFKLEITFTINKSSGESLNDSYTGSIRACQFLASLLVDLCPQASSLSMSIRQRSL